MGGEVGKKEEEEASAKTNACNSQQVQLHLTANQCILLVHQIEPALQVNLLVTFVF